MPVRNLALGALASAAVLLGSCSTKTSDDPGDGRVVLSATGLAATPVASLVVTVTAPDVPVPLVFNIPVVAGTATGTIRLPPGENRTVTVRAFDSAGAITHEGSVVLAVVRPGQNPPVSIPMVPRSGQVPLTVRIGAVSVVVTPATASLGVGAVLQLAAAVRAADGQALDVEPQWATTNPAVAVVDAGGLVTAVAGGEVEVVATVAGVAGTSRVTVVAPRWNGVHAVGTAGADWATDLALGPGGTVTICGYTYGAMAGSVSAGDRDAFVARFDAEGALLWVRQWGSPGSDTAFSVAVDDRGNAYVAGDGPSGAAGALQKFDPAGTLEWAASVPGWSNFLATAVVRGGDVYLSGIRYGTESFVARFSPDGTQRALDVFEPAGLFRLAPGPEGGWYLGGAPGAGRLRVERRDAAMNRVWSTELLVPGDSWISALVPRSDGVWLAFWTDDSWHGAPDPAEPWEYNSFVAWLGVAAGRLGDTSWLGVGFVEDLAVDSRGDLRVTGAAQRAGFAGSTDASGSVVAKLAQDGTVVWSADAPAGTGAYTSALALDPLDDAFVSGTGWATAVGNADAMIFRVDAAGTLR